MTNSVAPRSSLRPGSELDLLFTDLLQNGQAVGRAGSLVVFCFGPLPGEHARVRIAALKKTYAVAEVVAIAAGSPDRVEPFCPVFGTCGGCQIQHLAYEAQLRWKKRALESALLRIGGIAKGTVREAIGMANPREYRNKISLVVESRRDGKPRAGFYRMRSHDVVPIAACPVVTPQLDGYIGILSQSRPGSASYAALQAARHIVMRYARSTGEAVATISTRHALARGKALGRELRAELPGVAGIVNSFEPAGANTILGNRDRLLDGSAEIEERIAGIRYRVSTASFFQINPEIVERIFETIEARLFPTRAVVDLYCGMGTFSLLFARRGARVVGVEENARAVAEARANARLNGFAERTEFREARVEQFAAGDEGRRILNDAELVFLDPPRKGSDETTLGAVAAAGAPRIVYLSCDPATLARDLKLLCANGYRLEEVQPFDMFPQTGHVEALALLRKDTHVD